MGRTDSDIADIFECSQNRNSAKKSSRTERSDSEVLYDFFTVSYYTADNINAKTCLGLSLQTRRPPHAILTAKLLLSLNMFQRRDVAFLRKLELNGKMSVLESVSENKRNLTTWDRLEREGLEEL